MSPVSTEKDSERTTNRPDSPSRPPTFSQPPLVLLHFRTGQTTDSRSGVSRRHQPNLRTGKRLDGQKRRSEGFGSQTFHDLCLRRITPLWGDPRTSDVDPHRTPVHEGRTDLRGSSREWTWMTGSGVARRRGTCPSQIQETLRSSLDSPDSLGDGAR